MNKLVTAVPGFLKKRHITILAFCFLFLAVPVVHADKILNEHGINMDELAFGPFPKSRNFTEVDNPTAVRKHLLQVSKNNMIYLSKIGKLDVMYRTCLNLIEKYLSENKIDRIDSLIYACRSESQRVVPHKRQ